MPKDSRPGPKKPPKVRDAEITESGEIIITMNQNPPAYTTSKVILTPELIWSLAQEFGEIPPADDTDFPGIPVVEESSVFDDDEEDGEDEEETDDEPEEKD